MKQQWEFASVDDKPFVASIIQTWTCLSPPSSLKQILKLGTTGCFSPWMLNYWFIISGKLPNNSLYQIVQWSHFTQLLLNLVAIRNQTFYAKNFCLKCSYFENVDCLLFFFSTHRGQYRIVLQLAPSDTYLKEDNHEANNNQEKDERIQRHLTNCISVSEVWLNNNKDIQMNENMQ